MKFGIHKPSIRKSISAKTSVKRYVRHNLGIKAPKGTGYITNPKKALYNDIYEKTTISLNDNKGSSGIGFGVIFVIILIVVVFLFIKLITIV